MLTQIKNEFNEVLEDEEAAKSTYEKRSENLLQSSKIKMSASDNKTRLHTYENINKYLLNLDSIDDIFASLIKKREDIKKDASDDVEARTNLKANSLDFVKKYQSLWKLYDKYASAKKTMEEDIEDIRVYSALKNEASGTYRKFVNYQKSLNNLNERIRMGLDVDKNNELLRVNTAKANTLKNRVDYLNNRASDLLLNENVSAYVELNNKMDEIIRLIKQMDNEFLKYMN